MAGLAIMCGLPRSGKTTYATRQEPAWVRVSPDDIRRALHGASFIDRAEPWVWATAETMARSLLIGGRNVLIDATNTTRRERARWADLARAFDLTLEIWWIPTDKQTCLARHRASETVLDEVIRMMAARFEEPGLDEGVVTREVFHLVTEGAR